MFINVKRTFYDKMMRSEKNIWRNAKKRDSFVVGIMGGWLGEFGGWCKQQRIHSRILSPR